ncbi:PadR family transcriptional regulator [Streptomyces bambusae]|uniref:PadR family transcriptional regulator n=1 Tax=Streptomyces bambusae TaxID=1550616 RepID=A0ABS6ZA01_9ACTN|nr:PadR family transcriptional regulator [Streptomyces bambusae]MBW5484594.1 PadR family transcriptional regulator [Streptomyces bambusae]
MSIRHGLLALLERGPRYGSQLRTEFETRTGSTWPLNVGQVYTTLARLERDGLVVPDGEDSAGHALYAITDAGRSELTAWYGRPVDRTDPPRDELAIKLAMAVGASGVDIRAVVQAQRHHTIKAMQDYTRLKAQALAAVESGRSRERDDVAWLLVLEQLIFQTEAEARWLDHCESRLVRLASLADRQSAAPATPSADPSTGPPADPSADPSTDPSACEPAARPAAQAGPGAPAGPAAPQSRSRTRSRFRSLRD